MALSDVDFVYCNKWEITGDPCIIMEMRIDLTEESSKYPGYLLLLQLGSKGCKMKRHMQHAGQRSNEFSFF